VEQVVAEGARVCVLDPIKSDWWGLTSSADGKRPGLPFKILGGPHGHVPLHASAGKAVGEVVAAGSLPLSIIDMADFNPGGQAQFFNDFAPVLMRKMKGVLYLVLEEAHEFAPKERSGVGAENMLIHWAKKLATAGRSKGIRLILITQRTQSLHNALLGSCDKMIAHRMTAPADQEPIIKWLKANTSREMTERVASSMSSLPTGSGWICSGEAKLFELVKFPRIKTYDNSATPTGDDALDQVKTAPVDTAALAALIGEAVKLAEGNDPAKLKARIAELERQLNRPREAIVDVKALDAKFAEGYNCAWDAFAKSTEAASDDLLVKVDAFLESLTVLRKRLKETGTPPAPSTRFSITTPKRWWQQDGVFVEAKNMKTANGASKLSKAAQKILAVLSQFPEGCEKGKLTLLTGYSYSGSFQNALSELRTAGCIEGDNNSVMRITGEGMSYGPFPALPEGEALVQYWVTNPRFSKAARLILEHLSTGRPKTAEQLCEATGYSYSGSFQNALSELRTAGVIVGKNTEAMRISPEIVP
jgi:hypothetical protein